MRPDEDRKVINLDSLKGEAPIVGTPALDETGVEPQQGTLTPPQRSGAVGSSPGGSGVCLDAQPLAFPINSFIARL